MTRLYFFMVLFLVCCTASAQSNAAQQKIPASYHLSDTLIIPFEYKQSAIFHQNTLDALDSVMRVLRANKDITLSIEGYAYVDEGNDTICKYLALNRALFVRDCMLGRGLDTFRITNIRSMGQWKPAKKGKYVVNVVTPTRVEMLLIYPPPPKEAVVADADMDGIPDAEDSCVNEYGYIETKGCPVKNTFLVCFETGGSYIPSSAYAVLDKVLNMMKENPAYTMTLAGHASKAEGIVSVTDKVAAERVNIVYNYMLSRNFPATRIDGMTSYGKKRPVNAQRNPKELSENASVEMIINKHEEAAAPAK